MRRLKRKQTSHRIPSNIAHHVGNWIGGIPPEQIKQMAQNGESIVGLLRSQFGVMASPFFLRRFMKQEDFQLLSNLSVQDFEGFLDELLQKHPRQAEVLFQNKSWYFDQMRMICEHLLG